MRLPTTIQALLDRRGINMSEASRRAGLSGSSISRVINGYDYPSPPTLACICRAFPERVDQLALLEAWTTDKAQEAGFTPADVLEAFGGPHAGLALPAPIREALRDILNAPATSAFEELLEAFAEWGKVNRAMGTAADTLPAGPTPFDEAFQVAEAPGPPMPPPKPVTYTAKKPRKGKP